MEELPGKSPSEKHTGDSGSERQEKRLERGGEGAVSGWGGAAAKDRKGRQRRGWGGETGRGETGPRMVKTRMHPWNKVSEEFAGPGASWRDTLRAI